MSRRARESMCWGAEGSSGQSWNRKNLRLKRTSAAAPSDSRFAATELLTCRSYLKDPAWDSRLVSDQRVYQEVRSPHLHALSRAAARPELRRFAVGAMRQKACLRPCWDISPNRLSKTGLLHSPAHPSSSAESVCRRWTSRNKARRGKPNCRTSPTSEQSLGAG